MLAKLLENAFHLQNKTLIYNTNGIPSGFSSVSGRLSCLLPVVCSSRSTRSTRRVINSSFRSSRASRARISAEQLSFALPWAIKHKTKSRRIVNMTQIIVLRAFSYAYLSLIFQVHFTLYAKYCKYLNTVVLYCAVKG